MATKPAAKKAAPKKDTPARAPRVRKTEEQQLQEALAKVEALKAKTAEKGEKKVAARAAVDAAERKVGDLLIQARRDASLLPDFRAATVEFGRAVKDADALDAFDGSEESTPEATEGGDED